MNIQAINARLEEFLKSNRAKVAEIDLTDEAKQKELAQADEDEDFLDEGRSVGFEIVDDAMRGWS